MATAAESYDNSKDMPLLSNFEDVKVCHYILNLAVDFSSRVISSSLVLLLNVKNVSDDTKSKQHRSISLDCKDIYIESAWEICDYPVEIVDRLCSSLPCDCYREVTNEDLRQLHHLAEVTNTGSAVKLHYIANLWSVEVMPLESKELHLQVWQPRCICIKYKTDLNGASLTWAHDQDGSPCVFTQGSNINNRSLFPCQDYPTVVATWQAAVEVISDYSVLMSSDHVWKEKIGDKTKFYHAMLLPVPCSVVALVVGRISASSPRFVDRYDCKNEVSQARNYVIEACKIACRVHAVSSLIENASTKLLDWIVKYLTTAQKMLHRYPFDRLDVVIAPRCFSCLGLASPCLILLSQSVLSGVDCPNYRVAHEICHIWFGILIGPTDWTEEWFSEGFTTYLEDRLYCKTLEMSAEDTRNYVNLCCNLRYRNLTMEIDNTDSSLQKLRPKTMGLIEGEPISSIRQALNPEKSFIQVHYLKGFFLLQYIANIVGHDQFDEFLRSFVIRYCYQHVSFKDIFGHFFEFFPSLQNSEVSICDTITNWLDSPGLPEEIDCKSFACMSNKLYADVINEFTKWITFNRRSLRKKCHIYRGRRKRARNTCKPQSLIAESIRWSTHQIVLLLEMLLEVEFLTKSTLQQLDKCFNFQSVNAEIRHRWCELIIKHRYNNGYKDVEIFLQEDQGMGIYLYGELILYDLKYIAVGVFNEVKNELDRSSYQIISNMLSK